MDKMIKETVAKAMQERRSADTDVSHVTPPAQPGSPEVNPQQDPASALQQDVRQSVQVSLSDSTIEKVKQLSCREIVINPEDSENSPDLLQVKRLHESVLVDEEVLSAFMKGDFAAVREGLQKGGLFDHFHPFPDEYEIYESQHEGFQSVQEHLINDVLKRSNKPGTYHVIGMYDAQGVMRGYFSFRLPPQEPKDASLMPAYTQEMQEYVRLLQYELMTDPADRADRHMQYMQRWDIPRMEANFPQMMAIDTIVVEEGWRKGGTYTLIRNALQFIKNNVEKLPKSLFCYRFEGFPAQGDDGQTRLVGPNLASSDLFYRLGFTAMANRLTPSEKIIRRVNPQDSIEHFMEPPSWIYLYSSFNDLCIELEKRMRKAGLLKEGEELLS